MKIDGVVKSHFPPPFVIPAKAGVQIFFNGSQLLQGRCVDSRLRGSDGFSDNLQFDPGSFSSFE